MTTTDDFNYLFDLPNVQAVDYNPDTNTVEAMVTEKVPDDELDEDDRVRNNVDTEEYNLVVSDLGGEIELLIDFDTDYADTKTKHRPCTGGLSNDGGTEGFLARVTDVTASEATWDTNLASNGDVVRLSNNHVYWTDNELVTNEEGQPDSNSPLGRVCGGVERFQGNSRTDVAARTCYNLKDESAKLHLLPGDWPATSGTFSGTWTNIVGDEAAKSGGRTGATRNTIHNASVNVNLSGGTMYDCLKIQDLSKPGDSGSPVILAETGEALGLNFAGNSDYSFIIKSTNIEADLGVEILGEKPTDPTSGATLSGQSTNSVRVPMQDPAETAIEAVDIEYTVDPEPGETTEARVTFKGSQTGDFYVDCQGARYHEFSFTSDDADRTGTYDAYYKTVAVNITAPDSFSKGFDVDVDAGYYA